MPDSVFLSNGSYYFLPCFQHQCLLFNAVGEQKQTLRPRRAVAEATSDLQILYILNAVSVTCLMEGQGLTLHAWVGGSNGLQPGQEAEAGLQGAEYPASEGNKTLPTRSPSLLSKSLLTH